MAPDLVIVAAIGAFAILFSLFPNAMLMAWALAASPALRASRARMRHTRLPLSQALAMERDALHRRHVLPLEAGGPQALAFAASVLAWNALVMGTIHTSLVAQQGDGEARQKMALLSCLVNISIDPSRVPAITSDPQQQRTLLQDGALITDALFVHRQAFGDQPSVSWLVFSTLILEHALPGVRVYAQIKGDRTGTAWASAILARDAQGRFAHPPSPNKGSS